VGSLSFVNPAALLYLLPLGGAIVVLYLLKMKRRDVRVPASFLWPQRTEEVRANSLFQKLRFSWLLVLQLIALSLIILGFARPQARQNGLVGDTTVLVIDTGASMSATDVKPSRFGEAKRLALEAIRSAKPTDRIALIEAGPSPRVVFPLSNDPVKQERALETLQPTDAEPDVGSSLRLAGALVGLIPGARIVLLSDGDFEPVTNFSAGKAAVVYKSIGDSGDNLAISALGTAETASGAQLYCGVRSYSSKPYKGTLAVYGDGHLLDSISFQTAPKGSWGHTWPAPAGVKVFEAKLDSPDILKSDNYAVCLSDPGAALHVLLVSHGDLFLEHALALDPRVTLDRASELPSDAGEKYDIVVFDGVAEQPVKARGVLTFGAAGAPSPVTAKGSDKHPTFLSAEDSAVMKAVDLRGMYIDRAEHVSAKGKGQVLAQTNDGPLVVAAESAQQRQLYVAFEPLQSDFPLQVAFPIFIGNALDFLGGNTSANSLAVKAGVPFSLAGTSDATLTDSTGSRSAVKSMGGSVVVRGTKKVGVYSLEMGGKKKTVYATFRSDRASDVMPLKTLSLGGGVYHASTNPARFADFWRPLILLSLLVLGGEWWLFARRS
jgi:hypothetical protein